MAEVWRQDASLLLQLRENAEQYSGKRPRSAANGGLDWRAWLRVPCWRRDDSESVVCYALFAALFVADFSLLSLAFPVALFCYALLAQPPSRRFWQARHPSPVVEIPLMGDLADRSGDDHATHVPPDTISSLSLWTLMLPRMSGSVQRRPSTLGNDMAGASRLFKPSKGASMRKRHPVKVHFIGVPHSRLCETNHYIYVALRHR